MERHDTSSGCWSGGSTIQTVSDLPLGPLMQELNDQNLLRHNAQMKSSFHYKPRLSRSDCDESDHVSSADSGASSKARLTPLTTAAPPPTPPTRSDSIKGNTGFLSLKNALENRLTRSGQITLDDFRRAPIK